jgi:hypothetical protein
MALYSVFAGEGQKGGEDNFKKNHSYYTQSLFCVQRWTSKSFLKVHKFALISLS